jgi:hypothetical protein
MTIYFPSLSPCLLSFLPSFLPLDSFSLGSPELPQPSDLLALVFQVWDYRCVTPHPAFLSTFERVFHNVQFVLLFLFSVFVTTLYMSSLSHGFYVFCAEIFLNYYLCFYINKMISLLTSFMIIFLSVISEISIRYFYIHSYFFCLLCLIFSEFPGSVGFSA